MDSGKFRNVRVADIWKSPEILCRRETNRTEKAAGRSERGKSQGELKKKYRRNAGRSFHRLGEHGKAKEHLLKAYVNNQKVIKEGGIRKGLSDGSDMRQRR